MPPSNRSPYFPPSAEEPTSRLDSTSTLAVTISSFPSPPGSPRSRPRSRPRPPSSSLKASPRSDDPSPPVRSWKSLPFTSILSLVTGSLCLLALVLVLHHFENHPVPSFGSSFSTRLSLNTVVSIVTTAAKALLSWPLGEAVAAQKWLYFSRKPRRLSAFKGFDDAARGILGAGKLLWDVGGKNLAGASPFVMVLGLLLEPFSQQLVAERTTLVPVQGGGAAVGRATGWNGGQDGLGGSGVNIIGAGGSVFQSGSVPTGMMNAIMNGISNSGNAVLDLSPGCPGGNCTFESYQSLTVRARLADVSDRLSPKTDLDADSGFNTTTWCFPNGACFGGQTWSCDFDIRQCNFTSIDGRGLGPDIIQVLPAATIQSSSQLGQNTSSPSLLNFNESIAFTNISSPIADAFVLIQSDAGNSSTACDFAWGPWCIEPNWGYNVWELALDWSVQNYTTTMSDGVVTFQPVGPSSGNFSSSGPGENLTFSSSGAGDELYSVSLEAHAGLQDFFAGLFNGSAGKTAFPDWSSNWWATSTVLQSFITAWDLTLSDAHPDPAAFEVYLETIATSMTVYIQNQALAQNQTVSGTSFHEVPVVAVRWRWITALAIYTGLVALFVAATLAEQFAGKLHGAGNEWTSSLATLHALEPALQAGLGGITDDKRLAERDRSRRVKLEFVSGEGWRLREKGGEEDEGGNEHGHGAQEV